MVLLPQFETRRYIEAIERFACTWLTAVPPMLAMMFRESALLDSTDVSSVTAIRMGSAPVSERLRAQIKRGVSQCQSAERVRHDRGRPRGVRSRSAGPAEARRRPWLAATRCGAASSSKENSGSARRR